MRVGVLGAGTMGSGIAQLGCVAGAETLLLDAEPAALEGAVQRIEAGLAKGAERGRWDAGLERLLTTVSDVADVAGCDVVVEAVPEDLALKQRLFAQVAEVAGDECVLATNTSSLPVSSIAAPVPRPERVVGLHFFNPAPLMRLVEVVAGVDSADWALERARALGRAMGKEVVDAADGPGFLVNRCNRPFGLEALRLLEENIADVETIDRCVRLGGGFRMGPFELMDLVGVDVGFEVSKSFHAQSFGEPRWRPSVLQARMAASGRHGRKAGRGWYEYGGEAHRADDPEPPAAGGGDGLVAISGDGALARGLRAAAAAAGWDARDPAAARGAEPWLVLDCGSTEADPPLEGAPQALLVAGASLADLDGPGPAVGFHALAPVEGCGLVELTRGPASAAVAAERAERFFATLGKRTEWVGDAPGLVLGRIVCQAVNEAAFALGEGVGSAGDIDAGMRLGLNWPRGPLTWAEQIGLDHVAAVLAALHQERGDPCYRLAPALQRALALETDLTAAVARPS